MSGDRRRWHEEDGVALIAALLAVIALVGLSIVFVATATFEARSTGLSRDYEIALHVAEAAIDDLIPAINDDPQFCSAQEPPVGILPVNACIAAGWPITALADGYVRPDGATRSWIIGLGENADDDQIVTLADGEGFAVRPVRSVGGEAEPLDEIWAVGWVPSRANPVRVRALRVEFDHLRYRPDVGLLTGGDLDFGGNASITGQLGSVYANGNVGESTKQNQGGGSGIGSVSIEGDLLVAGSIGTGICDKVSFSPDSECRDGAGRQTIPHVDARTIYDLRDKASGMPWFDLCPGPSVKLWSAAGPCTGIAQSWTGNSFNGWTFEGPQGMRTFSRWKGINVHEGIYYVYHGNAYLQTTSGTNPRAVTVIAQENTADVFGNRSGHIHLAGNSNITSALAGLALIADRDIVLEGGSSIVGLVAMNEQIDVRGSVNITGAVLVEDEKDTAGSWVEGASTLRGTMTIHYDGGLDVPLSGVIRIISWDEL